MTADEESRPVTAVVVGAGVRGRLYADFALRHSHLLRVVAVAEPVQHLRDALADEHGVAVELRFTDWQAVVRV
ncbi:hypothetical protein [Kineosporia sp. A_224]|uniref:hypothetical protein n=1 Tax=Kineosporia sp. A_224 TaxID=1962180 RepID=UPI000B4BEB4F|nr:hypothetical protein [Kineosporia sp. A_224]